MPISKEDQSSYTKMFPPVMKKQPVHNDDKTSQAYLLAVGVALAITGNALAFTSVPACVCIAMIIGALFAIGVMAWAPSTNGDVIAYGAATQKG